MPQLSRKTGYVEKLQAPEMKALREVYSLAKIIERNSSNDSGELTKPLHDSAISMGIVVNAFLGLLDEDGTPKPPPDKNPPPPPKPPSTGPLAGHVAKLVLFVLCLLSAGSFAQDFQGTRSRLLDASAPSYETGMDYSSDNYRRPVVQVAPSYQYSYSAAPGCRISRVQLLQERYAMKQINEDYRHSQIKRLSFDQSVKISRIGAEMRAKQQ